MVNTGSLPAIAGRVAGASSTVLLAENGDIIQFDAEGGRVAGKAPAGRVLIDGTRTGEIADEVLRDRRHLAGDGLVVPVVAINRQSGTLEGTPDIITRGFVLDQRTDVLLREVSEAVPEIIGAASVEERTDHGLIRERLRVELQRLFRKRSGRRPLVLPVIMEI
jgi:ribonuclease J